MPQVFQVLCCYNCRMFQVHQIKKANKWQCKVCNKKQSHKKAFKIGSAPECRSLVQELNIKTAKVKDQNIEIITTEISCQDENQTFTCEEHICNNKRSDDNEYSSKSSETDCKIKSSCEVSDKNAKNEANTEMCCRNLQYLQTEVDMPKCDYFGSLSEVFGKKLKSFDVNNFKVFQKCPIETEFDVSCQPLTIPFVKKNRGFQIIKNAASRLN